MSCEHDMANGTCSQCDPYVVQNLRDELARFTGDAESDELAVYIFDWLETRNGGELGDALDDMTVGSRKDAISQLALILRSGGHPPHWEPLPASKPKGSP